MKVACVLISSNPVRGASELTIQELIGSINTSAFFVGTNPTGELIASGLPVTWEQSTRCQPDRRLDNWRRSDRAPRAAAAGNSL